MKAGQRMRKVIPIIAGWMLGLSLFPGAARGHEEFVDVQYHSDKSVDKSVEKEDGFVRILSPEYKAIIKKTTFTVKFKFEKQGRGDHIHVFLDGRLYEVVKEGDSVEIEDPGVGVHSIMLQVFTREHLPLAPYDIIHVKVE